MNMKVMRGFVGVAVVLFVAILLVSRNHPMMSEKSPALTVQKTRQKDFGFKMKVDECFTSEGKDYYIVDIDNNSTYVTADAKQYYVGPHPITEGQLAKMPASEMDKKSGINKVNCSDLEKKYSAEAQAVEDKKAADEAVRVAAETKVKPTKKSSKKSK